MNEIINKQYDAERSLYNLKDTIVKNCVFAGPADGESVLKETRNIVVDNCSFSLRYPIWHAQKYELINSQLDELTRAPLWYCYDGFISKTSIKCVKAVRECERVSIKDCDIESTEFGWKSKDIKVADTRIVSEYLFLESNNIEIERINFKGKYSFQYTKNVTIVDSYLDTKDAFWHSKNVTVKNTTIKGEYLAWFSDGLTLINCKIIGTQPLCYCKNLKLINCEMIDCDLSFEYSDVEADIKGHVISIKNPKSGKIFVDSVGEIIKEDPVMECNGEVIIR